MKTLFRIIILLPLLSLQLKSFSQPLSADAGLDSLICVGSSMVLGGSPSASGGTPPYVYTWSPSFGLSSASDANPIATPLSTTTYSLTVSDSLGAMATSQITVTVSPVPVVSAGMDQFICYGDSLQLNGSGGISYFWSPSGGLSDPYVANPVCFANNTTTYTLTAWNGSGCSGTDDITVTVDPPINLSIITTPASCLGCVDGSAIVNVSGGTAPFTYFWHLGPPVTSSSVNGLAAGVYTMTVTDAYGCTATSAFVISVGQCLADFTMIADTLLQHHYFIINNSTGIAPIQYVWNWGDGTPQDSIAYPSHTYSAAGFYTITLTITDSTNCSSTYTSMVQVIRSNNPMITVDVIPPIPTGISETSNTTILSVYPNPAANYININSQPGSQIEFYNLEGKKVKSLITNSDNTLVDISSFANGIYQIRSLTSKGMYTAVLVKE
ncbi:MAG: T9SS C-terminal target domain-containing protein [Bacteroidetes bacterium]|nr:MAG: T9SS C-terminal target domain-containing protein [Bacteroidota bacterium]REK03786.1 MAG: T9SS C-terminal target domain-containing protein [Bacteroidota bacterium]REK48741.1 MAG: T9SS C-terminal target domain-containing protein [Bacteroidota bacterium]